MAGTPEPRMPRWLCQPRHASRAWYYPFTLASGSDPRHESRVALLATGADAGVGTECGDRGMRVRSCEERGTEIGRTEERGDLGQDVQMVRRRARRREHQRDGGDRHRWDRLVEPGA